MELDLSALYRDEKERLLVVTKRAAIFQRYRLQLTPANINLRSNTSASDAG